MSKPKLGVVGAEPPPPATLADALDAAVAKAKAQGALTFLFSFQTAGVEPPVIIAYPDTSGLRRGLIAETYETMFPDTNIEFEVE